MANLICRVTRQDVRNAIKSCGIKSAGNASDCVGAVCIKRVTGAEYVGVCYGEVTIGMKRPNYKDYRMTGSVPETYDRLLRPFTRKLTDEKISADKIYAQMKKANALTIEIVGYEQKGQNKAKA